VLLQEKKSVRSIAKALGKTSDCVRIKIVRLGLEVVVQAEKSQRTTTTSASLVLPGELPLIEEELKVLAAILKVLFNSRYLGFFYAPSFVMIGMLCNY
jgi:hypothetical protein